jgi:DNA-binding transcriptional ArsR family regulator
LSGSETGKGADPTKTEPEVDMATAIGNPWRSRILGAAAQKDLSPSAFIREYGGEISNISRHFRQLAKWGYLEVVERKSGGSRRGGVEHVYRTARRSHLDTPASEGLSALLRESITDTILTDYLKQVSEAIEAGTFDADVERHLSWMALDLDAQAFGELAHRLDEVLEWLPELQAQAGERLAGSGEKPIRTTTGLSSFRSPAEPKLE